MKTFNLEEYLKNPSRKVVTRNGRKVRKILCTDRRDSDYPVVVLVEFDWGEDPIGYTKDGEYRIGDKTDRDLFFAPEKHEGWVNIFKGTIHDYYVGDSRVFESKEEAEKTGKEFSGYIPVKIEWEE